MELGLYTFADVGPEIDPAQRLRNLIEEIELADQVGLDVFGVGEHHRPDFAVSSPAVVLAPRRPAPRDIRLTSAVTVLSSDDPVRVFQEFATLDLLSGGRAEIMAGRGSFIESFPLFGYDLDDYDELFSEKLDLLLKLRESERSPGAAGTARRSTKRRLPAPAAGPLPVWIAVGGTPQSVVRAGTLGLPLAMAIIGGQPERFAPLVELYREAAPRPAMTSEAAGQHQLARLHRRESQQARDEYYPTYDEMMNRIGRERGWPPMAAASSRRAASRAGQSSSAAQKRWSRRFCSSTRSSGHQRFMAQISVGTIPHKMMHAIELFGTEVAPAVRKEIERRSTSSAEGPAAI